MAVKSCSGHRNSIDTDLADNGVFKANTFMANIMKHK